MKGTRLFAVLAAIVVTLPPSASRVSAQAPNVVIQWNQMLQTLFPGTGPGFTSVRCR